MRCDVFSTRYTSYYWVYIYEVWCVFYQVYQLLLGIYLWGVMCFLSGMPVITGYISMRCDVFSTRYTSYYWVYIYEVWCVSGRYASYYWVYIYEVWCVFYQVCQLSLGIYLWGVMCFYQVYQLLLGIYLWGVMCFLPGIPVITGYISMRCDVFSTRYTSYYWVYIYEVWCVSGMYASYYWVYIYEVWCVFHQVCQLLLGIYLWGVMCFLPGIPVITGYISMRCDVFSVRYTSYYWVYIYEVWCVFYQVYQLLLGIYLWGVMCFWHVCQLLLGIYLWGVMCFLAGMSVITGYISMRCDVFSTRYVSYYWVYIYEVWCVFYQVCQLLLDIYLWGVMCFLPGMSVITGYISMRCDVFSGRYVSYYWVYIYEVWCVFWQVCQLLLAIYLWGVMCFLPGMSVITGYISMRCDVFSTRYVSYYWIYIYEVWCVFYQVCQLLLGIYLWGVMCFLAGMSVITGYISMRCDVFSGRYVSYYWLYIYEVWCVFYQVCQLLLGIYLWGVMCFLPGMSVITGYKSMRCDVLLSGMPVITGYISMMCDVLLSGMPVITGYISMMCDVLLSGMPVITGYISMMCDVLLSGMPVITGYISMMCDVLLSGMPVITGYISMRCDVFSVRYTSYYWVYICEVWCVFYQVCQLLLGIYLWGVMCFLPGIPVITGYISVRCDVFLPGMPVITGYISMRCDVFSTRYTSYYWVYIYEVWCVFYQVCQLLLGIYLWGVMCFLPGIPVITGYISMRCDVFSTRYASYYWGYIYEVWCVFCQVYQLLLGIYLWGVMCFLPGIPVITGYISMRCDVFSTRYTSYYWVYIYEVWCVFYQVYQLLLGIYLWGVMCFLSGMPVITGYISMRCDVFSTRYTSYYWVYIYEVWCVFCQVCQLLLGIYLWGVMCFLSGMPVITGYISMRCDVFSTRYTSYYWVYIYEVWCVFYQVYQLLLGIYLWGVMCFLPGIPVITGYISVRCDVFSTRYASYYWVYIFEVWCVSGRYTSYYWVYICEVWCVFYQVYQLLLGIYLWGVMCFLSGIPVITWYISMRCDVFLSGIPVITGYISMRCDVFLSGIPVITGYISMRCDVFSVRYTSYYWVYIFEVWCVSVRYTSYYWVYIYEVWCVSVRYTSYYWVYIYEVWCVFCQVYQLLLGIYLWGVMCFLPGIPVITGDISMRCDVFSVRYTSYYWVYICEVWCVFHQVCQLLLGIYLWGVMCFLPGMPVITGYISMRCDVFLSGMPVITGYISMRCDVFLSGMPVITGYISVRCDVFSTRYASYYWVYIYEVWCVSVRYASYYWVYICEVRCVFYQVCQLLLGIYLWGVMCFLSGMPVITGYISMRCDVFLPGIPVITGYISMRCDVFLSGMPVITGYISMRCDVFLSGMPVITGYISVRCDVFSTRYASYYWVYIYEVWCVFCQVCQLLLGIYLWGVMCFLPGMPVITGYISMRCDVFLSGMPVITGYISMRCDVFSTRYTSYYWVYICEVWCVFYQVYQLLLGIYLWGVMCFLSGIPVITGYISMRCDVFSVRYTSYYWVYICEVWCVFHQVCQLLLGIYLWGVMCFLPGIPVITGYISMRCDVFSTRYTSYYWVYICEVWCVFYQVYQLLLGIYLWGVMCFLSGIPVITGYISMRCDVFSVRYTSYYWVYIYEVWCVFHQVCQLLLGIYLWGVMCFLPGIPVITGYISMRCDVFSVRYTSYYWGYIYEVWCVFCQVYQLLLGIYLWGVMCFLSGIPVITGYISVRCDVFSTRYTSYYWVYIYEVWCVFYQVYQLLLGIYLWGVMCFLPGIPVITGYISMRCDVFSTRYTSYYWVYIYEVWCVFYQVYQLLLGIYLWGVMCFLSGMPVITGYISMRCDVFSVRYASYYWVYIYEVWCVFCQVCQLLLAIYLWGVMCFWHVLFCLLTQLCTKRVHWCCHVVSDNRHAMITISQHKDKTTREP